MNDMSDIVIRCEGLSKKYRIGTSRQRRYVALRDVLTERFRGLGRRLLGRADGDSSAAYEEIWALKDVSFEVKRGECVGIIGRNGAGKSTLLKLLSRITEPTEGRISLRGRAASLLEVGTGFHPELTGRENVYLNGAILGMKRAEIRRKFDEIAAFAEVEKFLDTPVKHYSSGMYMRLAFAVAAHLEPEILIVDEVLAVGDTAFQKKCLGKMGEVAREGRTVLFVSHNMAAVQKLCPRGLLLDQAHLKLTGPSADVVRRYLGAIEQDCGRFNPAGRTHSSSHVEIVDAWLENRGERTGSLMFGDCPTVFVEVRVREPCTFAVELLLRQEDRLPVAFSPSGLANNWEIKAEMGRIVVAAELPPVHYATGRYSLDIMLAVSGFAFLDYVESALAFDIDSAAVGDRNWHFSQATGQGFLLWDVRYGVAGVGQPPYVRR